MNEDRFDRMMELEMAREGNIFTDDFRTLTPDTTIKEWLNRGEIGLGSLSDVFERKSIYTLGDLSRIYRQDVSLSTWNSVTTELFERL
ncbi:unnamed protein product [Cylicostephanus goldi]|uniref:CEP-1 C-terminal SAM domain-containing protein n=1 Tax=Cylicostephanus goldi TaxID=71465 RepID=A0A3P6R3F9_CYLGO|nr:unnamed protein product [Cylicostephanus goldi]